MFGYYLQLALRSFRNSRMLTGLMVLAIALGIGASMTTLTVFHVLSGDPIPDKSDRLFYVQLDAADMHGFVTGEEPDRNITRMDAETLLREARGTRQAMMSGGFVAVQPEGARTPFFTDARYTSTDFFAMFDAPLAHGRAWGAEDDAARARVAVISGETNRKVFGGGDSTGRTLRINGQDFQVIGVLDAWMPTPRFWDLSLQSFNTLESVFVPISTAIELKLSRMGSMNCWADSGGDFDALNAPCSWVQYWVELPGAADAATYRDYLLSYSEQQRAAGRFERPANVRLRDVPSLLDHHQVVPSDVRLQLWLALGFLLVCLVNTVGLLLAKSLRRASEIGVRRALGASRREIFTQFIVEAGAIGVAGGICGLGLALLGLWAVRQNPSSYAKLAQLDTTMLLTTFALSIFASLLAGMLPAWRAMQVTPAIQLKSQ